ncbi:UDP-glucose 6-dehydrogenase AglM [Halorussus pelagicus]|uniref:UDP-glucose 6-dehydrogenase AglM n=1 Tax=Halorussus pelagicus TaxID=2505977 RepID=UPI000FFC3B29|nr:UDP-glucose 6-dehydrogenase AglM [Halorussus pelagicus]
MQINIIGSGYVGTTVGACLADLGHEVTTIDIDEEVVAAINAGESPIHEPGLDDLLAEHVGGNLTATTSYDDLADAAVTFLAVQTPSRPDGSIDTGPLLSAARMAGEALQDTEDRHLVVVKSTVTPPNVRELREAVLDGAGDASDRVEVAANPEFQREGSAVEDFLDPQKIVFGTDSDWATERLRTVYAPLTEESDAQVVETDPETATMVKYANNVFLASKISLINELGNVCKEFGIDAYEVADAIGVDDRIGERFLRSGIGWGGSCFPKDTAALIDTARASGYEPELLEAVVSVNDGQPDRMVELLTDHVDVEGRPIAVLGLSFKPGTGDIRNSRAIPVIERLDALGTEVVAYDPVAIDNMRERFPEITYANDAEDALRDAHGALVVTDWDEFAVLDSEFDEMARPVVVDGRHVVERRDGLTYEGLTW